LVRTQASLFDRSSSALGATKLLQRLFLGKHFVKEVCVQSKQIKTD
jgi:hypothetical protein